MKEYGTAIIAISVFVTDNSAYFNYNIIMSFSTTKNLRVTIQKLSVENFMVRASSTQSHAKAPNFLSKKLLVTGA